MGKKRWRRQLLSSLLAVTLVFSDMSLSAFAMEDSATAQTEAVSTESETSNEAEPEVVNEGDAQEEEVVEEIVEEVAEEKPSVAEEQSQEPSEAASEATVEPTTEAQSTETASTEAGETQSTETPNIDESSEVTVSDEIIQEETSETTSEVTSETEITTEVTSDEITVEETTVADEGDTVDVTENTTVEARIVFNKQYYIDEREGNPFSFVYNESNTNPTSKLVSDLKNYSDYLYVYVAGEEDTESLKSQLTYTWQIKGADNAYTDMAAGEVPVNAGDYKLVISLDPKFAVADPVEIEITISKAKMIVDTTSAQATYKSGATVKEVKDKIAESIQLGSYGEDGEFYAIDRYKALVNTSIVVRETKLTDALTDDTVLIMGKDYSADVTVEVIDNFKSNYEVNNTTSTINLKINELQKTELTITNKRASEEKDITRTYTGEAVAEPILDDEISYEVVVVNTKVNTEEGTEEVTKEKLEVAYDKLTKLWKDAQGNELETAPVDAGVYAFVLKYTDETGVYAESEAEVKVVVEPVQLKLKPSKVSDSAKYYVGALATDITQDIRYELYTMDDKKYDYDPETFWGVSYNNTSKPQSYEPVFTLQKGETKTVDGNAVTTWTDVTGKVAEASGTKKVGDVDVTVSYRVVFAGQKALYNNGVPGEKVDINDTNTNSAETNYVVSTAADVIEANAVSVEISNATATTIDVAAMINSALTASDINAENKLYSKIYDGAGLYADRAEYKKAVVKTIEGTEVAKTTDDAITYEWYKFDIVTTKDKDGNDVLEIQLSDEPYSYYNTIPKDAGRYALKVSYSDDTHQYAPSTACIYFEIEPQLIKLVPEGTIDVYEGNDASVAISKAKDLDYKVYKILGNKEKPTNDDLVEITELSKANNIFTSKDGETSEKFYLSWFVEKGDNVDASKAKYTDMDDDDTFVYGVPYRIGADIFFNSDYSDEYYHNYSDNHVVVVDNSKVTKCTSDTVPVNVKKMGTTNLTITVDETKLPAIREKVYDGKGYDLTEAIANGLVTVTKEGTDEVVPITGDNAINLTWKWSYYDDNYGGYVTEDISIGTCGSPANARNYVLFVEYTGDDVYNLTREVAVGQFIITPREITITPALKETRRAGFSGAYNVLDTSKLTITGFIEQDAAAFAYNGNFNAIPAFNGDYNNDGDYDDSYYNDEYGDYYYEYYTSPYVTLNGSIYNGYLRTGKTYGLTYRSYGFDNEEWEYFYSSPKLNANVLYNKFAGNYKVVVTPVTFETNARGYADVDATSYATSDERIRRVEFTYDCTETTISMKPLTSIPYSYNVIVAEDGNTVEGNFFIFKVLVPDEFKYYENEEWIYENTVSNAVYANSIKNAGGYILNDYNLMSDGYITVAFNAEAPETGDNIRTFDITWEKGYTVTYTVDFTDVELDVNMREAVAPKTLAFNGVDGKMIVGETQQLDVKVTKNLINDVICLRYEVVDGKDFVSVTESGLVTALKKGSATVSVYPVKLGKDGKDVRLEMKKAVTTKITVSDVTAPKIKSVVAHDYYVAYEYVEPKDGYRQEIYILEGKGLKNTDFETKLANMDKDNFEGIKKINTSKKDSIYGLKPNTDYTIYVRNVSGIRTLADDSFVVSSYAGSVKSFKTTKAEVKSLSLWFKPDQKVEFSQKEGCHVAKLSDKSVMITTSGYYMYKESNVAADDIDKMGYDFPLTKEQQNTYLAPKLTYYVLNTNTSNSEKTDYYSLKIGDSYYSPATTVAKIDKKGNIKFTGIGEVYIFVCDSISGACAYRKLKVTADVTSIKAKNVTLKVGNSVDVYDILTMADGKTKLKGNGIYDNDLILQYVDGSGVGYSYGKAYAVVTANVSNKTAKLKVSLKSNPEISAEFTVKTKAMDAVKNLKASNIMDDRCDITFTHAVNNPSNIIYKVEVRNARNNKNMVYSEALSYDDFNYKYDAKKNVYTYTYYIGGLTRKSSYKISVTPMYREESAKTVTTNVKTTDIPATRQPIVGKDENGKNIIEDYDNVIYPTDGYLTSGHDYVFSYYDSDCSKADSRATDKLTWKSSDTKVVTIKATPGSYDATFKALKAGVATIEVSSKLRKGVIARFVVRVKAVGVAGDSALGDYANENEIINTLDPDYNAGVEVITEQNPVVVKSSNGYYDYKWVKFVAPADGTYDFYVSQGWVENRYIVTNDGEKEYSGSIREVSLNEGEAFYMKISGSFRATVTGVKATKLTTATSVNAADTDGIIVFTAPEDNLYTFMTSSADNKGATYKKNESSDSYSMTIYSANNVNVNNGIALSKGEKITIKLGDMSSYDISVSYRQTTPVTTTATSVGNIKKGVSKWYSYTAQAAGKYTFKSTDATGEVNVELYDSIKANVRIDSATADTTTNNFTISRELNKDDTVYFRVYTESETDVTANVSISLPAVDTVELGVKKEVTVAANGETWVAFTVDESNAKYTFDVSGTVNTSYYINSVTNELTLYNNKQYRYATKGDVIYIKLTDTTGAEVKANVLVTKAVATKITEGTEVDLTVANNGVYYYEFTAPSYGLYVFESKVTENATGDTHSLVADAYSSVNDYSPYYNWESANTYSTNDFYKEHKMLAGQKVIFAVKPSANVSDAAITTNAKISVKKVTPTDIPAEITFAENTKGATQWYKFKATVDDTYTITVSDTTGLPEVKCGATIDECGTVNISEPQTLSVGDVLYFKVVNTAATAAKLKLSVKGTVSEITEIPAEAFEVAANETVTFKYTPTATGRYVVNYESKTEGVTATVQVNDNYTREIKNPGNGQDILLQMGRTYYFDVTTSNTDNTKKASVTLSVSELVPADLSDSDITLKSGESKWFKYTVPATGRYIYTKTGDCDIEYYTSLKNDDTDTIGETAMFEVVVTKGTVRYIKITNNTGADATCKLSISKITPEALPAEVALKAGDVKYYAYTVPEDGYYAYSCEYTGEGYVNTDCWLNNNSYVTYMPAEFKKGDVILLKISAIGGDGTAKPSIQKAATQELKVGEALEVELKNGVNSYIKFTPSKSAKYAFRLKNLPDGVTVYSGGELAVVHPDVEYYCQRNCTIPNIYYFYLYSPDIETESKKVKLCVEEVVSGTITEAAAVDVTLDKYNKAYYTFTAPVDGRYVFDYTSDKIEVVCDMYEDSDLDDTHNYSSKRQLPLEKAIKAGESVTIRVYYNALKEGATEADITTPFKLSVKAIPTVAIADNKATKEMEVGETTWYTYTAPATAEYTFDLGNENMSAYIYKSIAEEYYNYYGNKITMRIQKGKTVAYKVTNSTSEKQTVNITVTQSALPQLTVGTPLTVEFTQADIDNGINKKWVVFKSFGEKLYKFNSSSRAYFYEELEGDTYKSGYNVSMIIPGGDEIYIRLYSYSPTSITLSVSERTIQKLTLNSSQYISLASGESALHKFTAPESGVYRFYSTNADTSEYHDTKAYLYDSSFNSSIYSDDEGDYNNFSISKYINKGEVVYLESMPFSDSSAISYYLNVEKTN